MRPSSVTDAGGGKPPGPEEPQSPRLTYWLKEPLDAARAELEFGRAGTREDFGRLSEPRETIRTYVPTTHGGGLARSTGAVRRGDPRSLHKKSTVPDEYGERQLGSPC